MHHINLAINLFSHRNSYEIKFIINITYENKFSCLYHINLFVYFINLNSHKWMFNVINQNLHHNKFIILNSHEIKFIINITYENNFSCLHPINLCVYFINLIFHKLMFNVINQNLHVNKFIIKITHYKNYQSFGNEIVL